MTINFDAAITDIQGKPIIEKDKPEKEGDPPIERPVTLGAVIANAMLANIPDDNRLEAAKKVAMFKHALKAQAGGTADLKSDEITLIKERIGKVYGTLIVGRAFMLLDPAEGRDEPDKKPKRDRGA